ncbi:hypothetical protein ANCCAN_07106 [Ancylostoma caninum]|uniref:Uncharacterized protein n=1 Tax=Ancylostoma caninum TaxID=29170 RepID=A0A368GVD8_ANCCA|nr:hypothetical protein ANCCAN_07106 [Ancylostoma caninum]
MSRSVIVKRPNRRRRPAPTVIGEVPLGSAHLGFCLADGCCAPPPCTYVGSNNHNVGENIKGAASPPLFAYNLWNIMVCARKVTVFFLLFIVAAIDAEPLAQLLEKLMKMHTEIKNQQLKQFISKAVPSGIDPPNPKIA